jgi:hypothetical protein
VAVDHNGIEKPMCSLALRNEVEVLYKTYLMLFDSRKISLPLRHVDTLQGDSYITCPQCFLTDGSTKWISDL